MDEATHVDPLQALPGALRALEVAQLVVSAWCGAVAGELIGPARALECGMGQTCEAVRKQPARSRTCS